MPGSGIQFWRLGKLLTGPRFWLPSSAPTSYLRDGDRSALLLSFAQYSSSLPIRARKPPLDRLIERLRSELFSGHSPGPAASGSVVGVASL